MKDLDNNNSAVETPAVDHDVVSLFTDASSATNGSSKELAKTAQLTNVARDTALKILRTAQANPKDNNVLLVQSQSQPAVLDKLIDQFGDIASIPTDYLAGETPEVLERMLKSQQSKRSRCKSMTMTLENYISMMSAAVAERLLRIVTGKNKGFAVGGHNNEVGFSEEEYSQLAANQEALGKAIRNIQSKKSIAKSKINFDPTSERWAELLVTEQRLKSLRTNIAPAVVDERIVDINKLLENIDVATLNNKDAKALLEQITNKIHG